MKKDELILELFFNEPTKHFHFEEILTEVGISRPQANSWLKSFIKSGLIKKIKLKGKMPYYVASYESSIYQNKKRLYALNLLDKSGFLEHLSSLKKAELIIVFGSFSRSDWYKDSDIDIFIYGNSGGMDKVLLRRKMKRDIQAFVCKDKRELKKYNKELLMNIVEGYKVKGDLEQIGVKIDA